jgi:hypothetical protein
VIDIWAKAGAKPTDSDSITDGHEPTLSNAAWATDMDLSDWVNTVRTDVQTTIGFYVDSAQTVTQVTIALKAVKL